MTGVLSALSWAAIFVVPFRKEQTQIKVRPSALRHINRWSTYFRHKNQSSTSICANLVMTLHSLGSIQAQRRELEISPLKRFFQLAIGTDLINLEIYI
jgi:hypothetical protein